MAATHAAKWIAARVRRSRREEPGRMPPSGPGRMPPSPLRNALQMINCHLLFNGEDGVSVGSAMYSIREELYVSPRRALREALRLGLVERHRDALGRACVRRGPRSAEALRRIYDGEPPTRESLLADSRAWDEYLEARHARLEAIREAARPKECNTAGSLPAWMP